MAHVRKGRQARKARQASAQGRAEERAKRSNEQQLALIGRRRGNSRRERSRLGLADAVELIGTLGKSLDAIEQGLKQER